MKLFMVKMRFLQMLKFITAILAPALVFGFTLVSCDTGTTPEETIPPEENNGHEMEYITIWPNPQEKRISVTEGTITVALLATGKYVDVWYDKTVPQPAESQLREIVFRYDNGYEKVTSFLGLYEKGGGPGGDGGGDKNPRIQTYIYDLYPAGGRYNTYNGESVYIDIDQVIGSTFTHELCHVIFYGNRSVSPETWYHEFLPIMSDVVFHGASIDWTTPNVELFGVWNNDGGSGSWAYYNTYRRLAKFLVDKYGDTILYDLYHETAINRQALENVLRGKGQTLSALETEFADWCNNYGNPGDNETRIIIISNVTLTGMAGVWLTSSLPSGNNMPTNTAIQSGTITNNTIEFSLVVPNNNTWNTGPAWLGSGDYYVYIVPIANNSYQWNNALVYTSDGSTPSRVTFNKAITRLSFENFGYPRDNETRIIIINNVSLTGMAGVWLASSLPSGNNMPTNTAIQSGTITNNTITFSLVVPRDNTWNDGPAWLGSGDYYVYIVPIANNSYQWNNALVYTSDGSTPSRVTFNKAITRLSFENFKRR